MDPNAESGDEALDPNAPSEDELDPNAASDDALDPNAESEDEDEVNQQPEGEGEQKKATEQEPTVNSMFEKKRQQIEKMKQIVDQFQAAAIDLADKQKINEDTTFEQFLALIRPHVK